MMDFVSRKFAFGDGDAPVVIGEIGVNHNGDADLAKRLIDVAVAANVDVVKFQVFKTENEISRYAELAPYQQSNSPDAKTQFDLCKALELSHSSLHELKRYCERQKIGFLCSVFDSESLAFLVRDLKVTSVKVASGEVTNIPLLEEVGACGLSVILSTGGSTLPEVAKAVDVLANAGCSELVLLHCVSSYPAPDGELNLRAMKTMADAFKVPVGFSDHSAGIEAALAAAALGACAIEKHFTIDRMLPGPDHQASLEPKDLEALVSGVKNVPKGTVSPKWAAMLGDGVKIPTGAERENLPLIRRSLVAKRNLRKGERLARDMIEIKRPEGGIAPGDIHKLVGRELNRDLDEDQPITWACLV
jgi:N-acetylneuraminate synthase